MNCGYCKTFVDISGGGLKTNDYYFCPVKKIQVSWTSRSCDNQTPVETEEESRAYRARAGRSYNAATLTPLTSEASNDLS